MLSLAQKKKVAKDLLKQASDKVVKALDSVPAEWDQVEIKAYIAKQFEDTNVTHELRGNTARGRAFSAELANNRAL
jgi:electron transfer flavoprotein alpha subunit